MGELLQAHDAGFGGQGQLTTCTTHTQNLLRQLGR